jgi:hypothetical protein
MLCQCMKFLVVSICTLPASHWCTLEKQLPPVIPLVTSLLAALVRGGAGLKGGLLLSSARHAMEAFRQGHVQIQMPFQLRGRLGTSSACHLRRWSLLPHRLPGYLAQNRPAQKKSHSQLLMPSRRLLWRSSTSCRKVVCRSSGRRRPALRHDERFFHDKRKPFDSSEITDCAVVQQMPACGRCLF